MRRGIKGSFSKIGMLSLAVLLLLGTAGTGLALWEETLTIDVTVETGVWDLGGDCEGTNGFWNNWDSHNTYTGSQIDGYLEAMVNGSNPSPPSLWLQPESPDIPNTAWMEAIFAAATGGGQTMEDKFLAHYLATRLNAEAGRLATTTPRDLWDHDPLYDPTNYLGVMDGDLPDLLDIINAIESKYPLSPPEDYEDEFEIMKDVCDGLNNLEISPWPFLLFP